MDKHDPKELHRSAIQKAIKLHSPYEVVAGSLVGIDEDKYAVVYRAPLGGDREIVMQTERRSRATRLRDRLNQAWALGYYSSGRD